MRIIKTYTGRPEEYDYSLPYDTMTKIKYTMAYTASAIVTLLIVGVHRKRK